MPTGMAEVLTPLLCVYQAVLDALQQAPTHGTSIIRARSAKCVKDLTMWRQEGGVPENERERVWLRDNETTLDAIWRELLRMERVGFRHMASGGAVEAWRAERSVAPHHRVEPRPEAHTPSHPTADSLYKLSIGCKRISRPLLLPPHSQSSSRPPSLRCAWSTSCTPRACVPTLASS